MLVMLASSVMESWIWIVIRSSACESKWENENMRGFSISVEHGMADSA